MKEGHFLETISITRSQLRDAFFAYRYAIEEVSFFESDKSIEEIALNQGKATLSQLKVVSQLKMNEISEFLRGNPNEELIFQSNEL